MTAHPPVAETPRPDTDALMATIGSELRALRSQRKLTVEELARRSSVSAGLISQTERGRGNPSFNTLAQLAHALQVPIGRLFHTAHEQSPVVRADQRRVLDLHNSGNGLDAVHELLTPGLDGSLEAVWVVTPVGYDTSDSPFSHAGEEFGIVLEGRHQVFLDGVCHELGVGDSITYASPVPHWYRNAGDVPSKAVWVITPPTF